MRSSTGWLAGPMPLEAPTMKSAPPTDCNTSRATPVNSAGLRSRWPSGTSRAMIVALLSPLVVPELTVA